MTGDEYRFRALEQRLDSLDHTVRAVGTAVGQVAALDADMDRAQKDISEIRQLVREVEAQVRSGPVETLKLIGVVVGVFAALSGATIAVAKFALGVG